MNQKPMVIGTSSLLDAVLERARATPLPISEPPPPRIDPRIYQRRTFHRFDASHYAIDEAGTVRRAHPKVKGKAARKAAKRRRHGR